MKKTIITLLALAGMAQANTIPQVIWDADFTSTSGISLYTATGVTISEITMGDNYTISNGAITLDLNKFSFQQTSGKLSYADEFSMLVKLKIDEDNTYNQYPVLFSLGSSDNNQTKQWKASYYQATDKFVLDHDNFSVTASDTGNITYTVGTDGEVTLALTNNGSGVLNLYVNGVLADTATITNENQYNSNNLIQSFSIGGKLNDGNQSIITVSDAQFVKGITTSFVTLPIPEPATATLSLLALAGMAMRRRRK